MKRKGNLWNQIISNKNLFEAIEEVNKSHRWCSPGKPNKTVIEIELHKAEYVVKLREVIRDFRQHKTIPKRRWDRNAKKWRNIEEPRLWPDQYVHHALIQVIMPILMRGMDRWTCGSIPGRGAIDGVKVLKKWMKNPKETRWCAECDIRHFYDTLAPKIVMERMKRLIKDWRTLDLIWRIIKDGIKIGFYTSQWFGNVSLQPLDQMIRDIGIHRSIRYLDNFTMFHQNKRKLQNAIKEINKWLRRHKMELKGNWQAFKIKNKTEREITKAGMSRVRDRLPNALGYRFGRGFTILRKNGLLTIKRDVRRILNKYKRKAYISVKQCQGLLSRLGRLRHCNRVRIYEQYIPVGTQKLAKDIIRRRTRKEQSRWNLVLAHAISMENLQQQSA